MNICRSIVCGISLGIVVSATGVASAAPNQNERGLDLFERRVRPILVSQCQECHGPEKQESSLRLDRRDWVLQGGDSGPAVTPGKPGESLLIEAVRYESFEMPPHGKLPSDQIAALEQWVRIGAPWPDEPQPNEPVLGDQQAIRDVANSHWSLQPIEKPSVPDVSDPQWIETPVDRFVLSKLEEAGLRPSPPADKRTLLRRVTFDLIGLPPTEAEIEEFLADDSPGAYEKVVDRLLASPHYGERWARHWLDVARYADTRDWQAQVDPRYPFAYTYRDYVIRALNEDKPYDEFIREQLAADFYTDDKNDPSLAALGFLTVGPRYRNNTHEQIADRIDVVGRGLLGMTVVCARCHDHKYDPIPIEDYYSLYGVFASVEEPERLPLISTDGPPPERVADYEQKRQQKVNALKKYQTGLQTKAHADLRKRYEDYLLGYYEMNVVRSKSIRGLISSRKIEHTAMTPLANNLDRIRKQAKYQNHPALAPWAALIGIPDKEFPQRQKKYLQENATKVNPVVQSALEETQPATRREMLLVYADVFQRAEGAKADSDDAGLNEIRHLLHDEQGPFFFDLEEVTQASRLLGAGRRKLGDLTEAILEVDASHPGAPPRAMSVAERENPITPRVFLRGDPQRRGDAVPRRFLSMLGDGERETFAQDSSGRRGLAEAIVDPGNPLTPRVMVNRVWMHHFGAGLVNTPGDLGLRSDPPSHPELLDWLSATFIESDWSLKHLHRLIVLSNTYRQASDYDRASGGVDPRAIDSENRLLWRFNRRRLDFEAMRDAMLTVAGRLDRTIGGRSVPLVKEPFTTRRTLYGYIDRVNLDPIFSTFDFASPDATAPQRPETLVPQQALFAMNHPFVIEQAKALAALLEEKQYGDASMQIDALYRRVFSRPAKQAEIAASQKFLERASDLQPARTTRWQYGYGPADFSLSPDDRFEPLTFWTGSSYQVSSQFPDRKLGHIRLAAGSGHPGKDANHAVVRRWTAPADVTIAIDGELKHPRKEGDGVMGYIVAGRDGVLGEWKAHNGTAQTKVERYHVTKGETIDFVGDCIGGPAFDGFTWAPTIRQIDGNSPTTWDARKNFGPPPPPLLGPWEQIAQALLLTNEFMFVD